MKLSLLAILTTGLAVSCATAPPKINAAMDPWVGESVGRLIEVWGPPAQVTDLPNASGKTYSWIMAGSDSPVPCRLDFTVAPAGVIQAYRYSDSCRGKAK